MNRNQSTESQLEQKLAEAEQVLEAIRSGQADAVVSQHDVLLLRLRKTEKVLREQQEAIELQNQQLRQAQAELERSRRKYSDLFELAPIGYFLVDGDGRLMDGNRTGAALVGVDKTKLAGERFYRFVQQDDQERFVPRMREALQDGTCSRLDLRMLDGEQHPFHAELLIHPVTDGGEVPHCRIAVVDITARKQAEEKLQGWNEALEECVAERTRQVQDQADRLRRLTGQLSQAEQRERKRLAKILHDHIQQLMVAARMHLGWIQRDLDAPRRQALQEADAILREALDASRSLAVDLSPPILHEAGLVGGLKWLIGRMQEMNRFTVTLSGDETVEPDSEDVQLLLFECVRELLLNAVKHAGVSEAQIALSRPANDGIKLVVSDAGKGFDTTQLCQASPETVTYGLFCMRERLEQLGGHMDIQSAPGRGTQVTLTITAESRPMPPAEPDPTAAPSKKTTRRQRTAKRCRVLICDDHKIVREGLVRVLQFEPDMIVVGEAADGEQALQLTAKTRPDVVIMDITLGRMSGVETTKRILAHHPGTKVIGLSMHTDKYAAKAMQYAGAAAYLAKAGPSEDLIAAVRSCMQPKE